MAVLPENRDILKEFVRESARMLTALDISCRKAGGGGLQAESYAFFRFFHSMRATVSFLELEHLSELAASAENLARVMYESRDRSLEYYLDLLCTVCRVIQESLPLVLERSSDEFMETAALVMSLDQALDDFQGMGTRKGIFRQAGIQAREILTFLDHEFRFWNEVADNRSQVLAIVRRFGKLQRLARTAELTDITKLSGAFVTVLQRYLEGDPLQGKSPEAVFLRATDAMLKALEPSNASCDGRVEDMEDLIGDLEAMIRQPIGALLIKAGLVAPDSVEDALKIQEKARQQNAPVRRLGEVLVEMGEVTEEQVDQVLARQQILGRPFSVAGPVLTSGSPVAVGRRDITVDSRQLQQLLQLVDELEETRDRLMEVVFHEGRRQLSREINRLDGQVRSIRNLCNTIYCEPVTLLQKRLERFVHDLEERTGRPLRLTLSLETIFLEKDFLDALSDSLVHLVQNVVDHGLETPEVRRAAGKPEVGAIEVRFRQRGMGVEIVVEDDGRGIDPELVRRCGQRCGLLPADSGPLTPEKAAELVVRLGFSTAETVTDSAGRGIGLDVVQCFARQWQGELKVHSSLDQGTRVSLFFPQGPMLART
ncbi:ATP-binding protein [Desulfolithobacter sp.]